MKNNDQVIIEGNAVYEIDMECKKQIKKSEQVIETQSVNKGIVDLFIILVILFY